MKKPHLKTAWKNFLLSLRNNEGSEEMLLNRLEQKLGKSKDEVKLIISESLMTLLAMVPMEKINNGNHSSSGISGTNEQDEFMWI
jgi:hypothetical protein